MLMLALLSASTVWAVAAGGLAAMGLAGVVLLFPRLVVSRPDPIQRAFGAGCACILLWGVCAALGVVSAGAVFLGGGAYTVGTRVMGWMPLGVAAVVAGGLWMSIERDRARSRRKRMAERSQVPEYIVVTDKAEEVTRIYHALRALDGDTEINVFEHPQALRWQMNEHLPRARVIAMKAWTKPRPGEDGRGDTTLVLARDLAEEEARCPILLFGEHEAEIEEVAAALGGKWVVVRERIEGEKWVEEQLVRRMRVYVVSPVADDDV